MEIRERLKHNILIFDGAMGTLLVRAGLQTGKLPEVLNFSEPEALENIFLSYYEAGSDVVSTHTFGANRYKLAGSDYTPEQIIAQGVGIARRAAEKASAKLIAEGKTADQAQKYVALDIASIGKLLEPYGDLTFDDAYDMFREQVLAGEKAGADLILFETFTDLAELRIAVLAAKENTNLPVFCSVTFEADGRMLMGTDPQTMVNVLQDMGVDALGVNCSLGPAQMVPIVKEILSCSRVPVLVQPNAGLPKIEDGQAVYDVDVAEYTKSMMELLEAGISIAGGCCGTGPEYIKSLTDSIKGLGDEEARRRFPALRGEAGSAVPFTAASSITRTVRLDERVRIIGERINPTGKKALKEALKSGDYTYVENEAIRQVEAGAELLDINVGLPEIDEKEAMLNAVSRVSAVVDVPLQIDSSDPLVLEAAVRRYPGKAIINSVNGKQSVMEAVFPIAAKYGSCLIALTLDEKGLPQNTEERLAIAERIINKAGEYGIGPERIIVDCLTLTVSAQQNAGLDTLEAIRQVKAKFGVKTTLGASNVSFGLPERKLINRTFLAMALSAGLDAPITDPTVPEYVDTIRAFEVLANKDQESTDFIEYCKTEQPSERLVPASGRTASGASEGVKPEAGGGAGTAGSPAGADTVPGQTAVVLSQEEQEFEEIILNGYTKRAKPAVSRLLETKKPLEIVEGLIIPALTKVGRDYESGAKFLPELIRAADTVQSAFEVLREAMKSAGEEICYGTVVVATVQGDIHDIGKNIVKVILENYGYQVIDLGKDVAVEAVVAAAKEHQVKLVGLSALMTTTVVNMEATIKALAEAGVSCKVAVGGAVLNAVYAEKIGADYYCKDALDTVRAADEVYK